MSAGQLQLFDVNYKQSADLLAILARTKPACSIPSEEYIISQYALLITYNQTIPYLTTVSNKTHATQTISGGHEFY
jgi:hypothetical protein